jgi:Big-like domain-containing protein
MRTLSLTAALLVGTAIVSPAQNTGYTYKAISAPDATSTVPVAINASGQIAGYYDTHGFVYSNGVYTTIDVPGASTTSAYAISDSGLVYGGFTASTLDPASIGLFQYNFNTGVLTTSTFTPKIAGETIEYAFVEAIGPTGTVIGSVFGNASDASVEYTYFLYSNGKMTVFGYDTGGEFPPGPPNAVTTAAVTYFHPVAVNAQGAVVGSGGNNTSSGNYLYTNGTFIPLPAGLNVAGIGPADQLVGFYSIGTTYDQDVLYSDGVITVVGSTPPLPASSYLTPGSYLSAVSASGQIIGTYTDTSEQYQGFLLTPSVAPPAEKTRVNIDLPNANAQASGTYTATGWAVDNTAAINAVSIQVDGQFVGVATYGNSRSDVCAVYSTSPGCPNVGWTYALNTSALADGLHTLAAIAVSNNGTHAVASTSFTVANAAANTASAILMNIDVPNGNGSTLSGVATLAGWAFDTEEKIGIIEVAVDPDLNVFNNYYYQNWAVLGGSRPDVCAALSNPPNCANSGWSYSLDTTQLSNGAHTLAVIALTPSGNTRTLTSSFSVSNSGPLRVNIDVPAAKSAAISGSITIAGWAEDDNAAIGSVTYSVDGANFYSGSGVTGSTYLGGYRPDVCATYAKSPDCPNVGWSARLDTTQLTNGTHTLTITATSQFYTPTGSAFFTDDTLTSAPVTFTVSNAVSSQSTHINIDQPTPSQVLWHEATVSGWAVDDNTAIKTIAIAVDGQTVGSTTPSISRPDVCAVFQNRPGCPNVGWSASLDTDLLTNGAHTITVTAVSEVDAEATTSTTINVTNGNGVDTTKVNIDVPNAQSGNLSGPQTFAGWAINDDANATVTIFIDGVTDPGVTSVARPDVCAMYPDAGNCPNVGWSIPVDTTLLANGVHTLQVVATSSTNPAATASSSTMFTVANLVAATLIKMSIDVPGPTSAAFSGVTNFAGWAAGDVETIADVQISVDGVVFGDAYYGNNRPDVCKALPTLVGCPAANVGWSFAIDTTLLANGPHTVEAIATTPSGITLTTSAKFTVTN